MLVTIRVTLAEARQMLAYAEERDRNYWYYGEQDKFEKRHESIKEILERAIDKAAAS
jgi:hypothetical protein